MTLSKRFLDFLAALTLSMVLGPPFAVLLLVLLVVEGRPIFYVAERMRTPERAFGLWKLRTMTAERGAQGTERGVSGGDKAARVTRVGRRLRRYRLDEIPQLWNVLKGDMSFVGPRPPLREYVERFPDIYAEVLKSRPGITGAASLLFHDHEERLLAACRSPEETDAVYCRRCIPRKARIDLIYARKRSNCSDFILMLRTAGRMLRRR